MYQIAISRALLRKTGQNITNDRTLTKQKSFEPQQIDFRNVLKKRVSQTNA